MAQLLVTVWRVAIGKGVLLRFKRQKKTMVVPRGVRVIVLC